MNSSRDFMLLLLVIYFSTSYVKTAAESVPSKHEKETKATYSTQSDSSNFIIWSSTEGTDSTQNGTEQLILRQKRNIIPGMEDLLNDKHHNDKRSVLVFKQQVLEIQLPDSSLTGHQIPQKFKHKAKHHKNAASELGLVDLKHSLSSKDTDDAKEENVDIVIKKTSHKDNFGNKLEKIHSNTNKITVSKVASVSPFQELPGLEYPNSFLPNTPDQNSRSSNNLNIAEHEPLNQEFDENNQVFNLQNEDSENSQGSDRFIDQSNGYFPPEINNYNQFDDPNIPMLNNFPETDGHVPDIPLKYSNGNQDHLSQSGGNTFIDQPNGYFPPEKSIGNQFEDTNMPMLSNFQETDGHNLDVPLKYSNGNSDHQSGGNALVYKPHDHFPYETRNNYNFDDTGIPLMNNFPENHEQVPDVSMKYSNGNPESLNPSEGNIGNRFIDKSNVQFAPENGNNMQFEGRNNFPETNPNIQDISSKNFDYHQGNMILSDGEMLSHVHSGNMIPPGGEMLPYGHSGNMIPPAGEMLPNSHQENMIHPGGEMLLNGQQGSMIRPSSEMLPHSQVGESVHEVVKKEEKIHEVNSQLGNKEVTREISKETSNTVSRKVSEDSNPLMNSELIGNHLQEIPHVSINFRPEDEHLKENDLSNRPLMNNPEPFKHVYEVPQISTSILKRNDKKDLESQINRLNANPYDRPNGNGLSNPLFPNSLVTRQENLGKTKNFPVDLEKMKDHPIDLGEIKNYPFIQVHKDARTQNKDDLKHNGLLEIFFPPNNHQVSEEREKKQADFRNAGDTGVKNFNKFKREPYQFERSSDSVQNTSNYMPASSNTMSSTTQKTEKRESVIKRLSDVASPHNKKNLLYIRKRMVEILFPNGSSKDNENAAAKLRKLPFFENSNNRLYKYNLQNGKRNNPYRPNNQQYSGSQNFENPEEFPVSHQSNVPGTSQDHFNFVALNPKPEGSASVLDESSQRKQDEYEYNVTPQENIPVMEEDEVNVARRETPMKAETLISQLLDMSSNKKKRNVLPPPANIVKTPKYKRKKKSHKAFHVKRKHIPKKVPK